jgi:branched-chain amino acid transport system permease protein
LYFAPLPIGGEFMTLAVFLSILVGGICTGGLYALVSAAFTFQFGSLNIVNFAFGSLTMMGMFLSFQFCTEWGFNPLLFALLFILFYFVVGYFTRSILLRSKNHNVHIIVTTGLSLLLDNLALFIWTAFPRTMSDAIPPTWKIPIGDEVLVINQISVLTLVLAAVVLFGFGLFLKKTWLGTTIRAVVEQREISYLMGINSEHIINIGFGFSFVMLAVASMLIALQFTIEPTAGHYYQLMGFLVCLIAGMGNLYGTFFSGLTVGIISGLINIVSPMWHDAIIFILFIIVLLLFPRGIFISKKSITRSV